LTASSPTVAFYRFPMHLVVYGPQRAPSTLDQLSSELDIFGRVVVVSYIDGPPVKTPPSSVHIRIADPGAYEVAEEVGASRRTHQSNSLRQFATMRAGLEKLVELGADGSELVCFLRSDLTVPSKARFRAFMGRAMLRIRGGRFRECRLTTNSVNPFSFTGHGIHASDWVMILQIDRALEKLAIDPRAYRVGHYGRFAMARKGEFCYGAFAAEELLSVAHYPPKARDANSLNVPIATRLAFLADHEFVAPAKAGIRLDKWRYLYDPSLDCTHPFGVGIRGLFRRYAAFTLFTSELVPPSGPLFYLRLAVKSVFSWLSQSLRYVASSAST
jgi:hypothetical protein